jgi:hypothetical protein
LAATRPADRAGIDATPAPETELRAGTWTAPNAGVLLPLTLFALALLVYGLINNGKAVNLDYFVPLADSFLHGRLDVTEHPPWLNELVPFNGLFYVVYPPAPALLLLPFVALFGPGFDQGGASLLIGAANVALMTNLLQRMGFSGRTWVILSVLFGFGTIMWYSAQAGSSWHFAHICAIFFLLLAIRDAVTGGPTWRMGLFLGLATLSRLPVVMATPFFLAAIAYWTTRSTEKEGETPQPVFGTVTVEEARARVSEIDRPTFLRLAFWFFAGLLIPLWLYLIYNLARFGNPFTTGYDLIPGLLQEHQYRYGFFSIHSTGRNLFALLLQPPRQVDDFPWLKPSSLGGLSLLLTTPAVLWAIRSRAPNWFNLGAWLAVGLISIPVLLHADPGGVQFGYRYALDFMPFLFLLAARGIRTRLSFEALLAIGISLLVNIWGMWAWYTGWIAPP